MQLVQNAWKAFFNTFFNFNGMPTPENTVDVRDLPMVARFTNTDNPINGWGYFILEAVNKEQSQRDAFRVTDEGYTYYEARLYATIQENFRARNGLIVKRETIEQMEREASHYPDYYTRLAAACNEYEKNHVQIAA